MKETDTEIRKEILQLRCPIPEAELLELGKQLAEAQQELQALKDDKKDAMTAWKNRINSKEEEIVELSEKVSDGHDVLPVECEITLNEPPGQKTTRRVDTGEVVSVADLTDADKQRTLSLEPEPEGDGESSPEVVEEEPTF